MLGANKFVSMPSLAILLLAPSSGALAQESGRLGFVVESWYTAVHDTPYLEECPEGLTPDNAEIWFNGLSLEDKEIMTRGGTADLLELPRSQDQFLRGPNGEDICWNPEAVVDPPMRLVHGKYSYGMNLDGNEDGSAGDNTCKHDNFVSPDGKTQGVDNQLYRLLGCVYGYRSVGSLESASNRQRQFEGKGVILIDVAGVDDPRNDAEVSVSFYLSATPPHLDSTVDRESTARIIPFGSYQAVSGLYGDTVSGKIVDGVLTTESRDVALPLYGHNTYTDLVLRDFQMEMEISDDGTRAKGLWAGYHPIDSFWDRMQKSQMNVLVNGFSCPAMYVAMKSVADGYPDPDTGQCTALSSAFSFDAVSAFVIPDGDNSSRIEELYVKSVKAEQKPVDQP